MATLPPTPPDAPPPPAPLPGSSSADPSPPSPSPSPPADRPFTPSITTTIVHRARPGPGGDDPDGLSRPHRCNAQLSDIINAIFDAPTAVGTPLRAFFRCLRAAPGDPEYNVAGVAIWGEAPPLPPPPSPTPSPSPSPPAAGGAGGGDGAA